MNFPNVASATHPAQAVMDATDLAIIAYGDDGIGVVSGLAVIPNTPTSMTAKVAAGSFTTATGVSHTFGTETVIAVGNAGTGDRRDLVVAYLEDGLPAIQVIKGTPSPLSDWAFGTLSKPPIKPAVPNGAVAIAEIYVVGVNATHPTTKITSSEIVDKRIMVSLHQGSQGVRGVQGVAGAQGSQGFTGLQGATGYAGVTGTRGHQGVQGYQGRKGTTGTSGATGAAGNQGAQGKAGFAGLKGPQGGIGGQGPNGPTGAQGRAGYQGEAGLDQGAAGAKGSQGATGARGPRGTVGPQGTDGNDGATGADGRQGATGSKGSQGAQGSQGDTGATGSAGAIGASIAGARGPQGFAGENSVQVGSIGNQGRPGFKGFQGPQGNTGIGTTGPTGTTGSQGFRGDTNVAGDGGSTGATGAQGAQGDPDANNYAAFLPTGYVGETFPRVYASTYGAVFNLTNASLWSSVYLLAGTKISSISAPIISASSVGKYAFLLADSSFTVVAGTTLASWTFGGGNTVAGLPLIYGATGGITSYIVPTDGLYYTALLLQSSSGTAYTYLAEIRSNSNQVAPAGAITSPLLATGFTGTTGGSGQVIAPTNSNQGSYTIGGALVGSWFTSATPLYYFLFS